MAEMQAQLCLEQVLDKYDQAEKHVHKLNTILREWRDIDTMKPIPKTNLRTGDVSYHLACVPVIPSSVPLIVGDILHSLRGSLDYVACGLIEVVTRDAKFPIAHSAEAYISMLERVVPGIWQDALKTLNSIKPYQGGNALLWMLHKLNIIDKHRLLLAVCIVNSARVLAPDERTAQKSRGPEAIPFNHATSSVAFVFEKCQTMPVPLDAGKAFITLSAAEAKKNVGFYFAVSINEPSISERLPLKMLLDATLGKLDWLSPTSHHSLFAKPFRRLFMLPLMSLVSYYLGNDLNSYAPNVLIIDIFPGSIAAAGRICFSISWWKRC